MPSTASSTNYDAAEYKRVEDDGSILLNVFVTAEEKAALKAKGYKIGARHRGLQHRSLSAWRSARRSSTRRRSPPTSPRTASRAPEVRRQVGRPDAGRHGHPARRDLHGRGRPVRRHARPRASSTSRRSTSRRSGHGHQHRLHRPGAGAVLRRRRRRLQRRAINMGRFIDTDPTPDEYMYHRQLIRLTGATPTSRPARSSSASPPRRPPAAPRPASRPSRSPSGSARTSRRTSPGFKNRVLHALPWTRPRTAPTSTRWPRRTRS